MSHKNPEMQEAKTIYFKFILKEKQTKKKKLQQKAMI